MICYISDNNTLSSGPFSPSNVEQTSAQTVILNDDTKPKTEPADSNPAQVLVIKSESSWDFENTPNDNHKDIEWDIEMDAKSVLEACRLVIYLYNAISV